jgi:hypothetical protein
VEVPASDPSSELVAIGVLKALIGPVIASLPQVQVFARPGFSG